MFEGVGGIVMSRKAAKADSEEYCAGLGWAHASAATIAFFSFLSRHVGIPFCTCNSNKKFV